MSDQKITISSANYLILIKDKIFRENVGVGQTLQHSILN